MPMPTPANTQPDSAGRPAAASRGSAQPLTPTSTQALATPASSRSSHQLSNDVVNAIGSVHAATASSPMRAAMAGRGGRSSRLRPPSR